ncbi:MAG: hypothetical protein BECKG1743D_GA0114223_101883 [Candidatus Kentron sp. G]|nr:MAG: hypothetical protein BECKG1743F_GA0114225_101672 [Candidatus Kentron sp. G]VFN00376.1 MAG: hypothetical protein BECKG1743D_GA0114223_101883 [Candidatus Kentron sp. G]
MGVWPRSNIAWGKRENEDRKEEPAPWPSAGSGHSNDFTSPVETASDRPSDRTRDDSAVIFSSGYEASGAGRQ